MTKVISSFWLQVHNRDIYSRASSSFPFKPPQLQSATAHPHQISLVQLSRLVASRGQHVTIVTTPDNAELFQKTIDDDIAFDHHICVHVIKFPNTRVGLPEAVENLVSATMSTTAAKIHMAAHFIQPQIEAILKESHPNIFIPDILFTWSKDLSKTFQIQRLVFNPISIFDTVLAPGEEDVGDEDIAVSYTHLDVYKRQSLLQTVLAPGEEDVGDEDIAVSYTHLDVYKRQSLLQKTIDDDIAFDHHICVHVIKFPNTRVGLPEAVANLVSATMSTTAAQIHMAAHFIQPQIEAILKESHPNVFIPDILFTWSKDLSKTFQIQRLVFNPISIFDVCMIQAIKTPRSLSLRFCAVPDPRSPSPSHSPGETLAGFRSTRVSQRSRSLFSKMKRTIMESS
ncbi:UDP-glucosyl transferase 73C [Vigna unguiculata]|uniref:UDP-glucosyl transferase 73C n=1 Tax=Vigna unguiculata TaxID=3917 RepID=A0A4D6KVZ9_VIGUN|nr:UDP-glucosyl transferase 73C [Vigna unguiculata]